VKELVILALSSYAVTFVVASSSLLEPLRNWIMRHTPWLKIGKHNHFVACRMCVGFWVSLLVCFNCFEFVLPVYGLSYFLATQER
jgi:hypothetical protein